jgi:hypothetical protein
VPAQQTWSDLDAEVVDLLSRDPQWLHQAFDAIIEAEFPPAEPPPDRATLAGVLPPQPSGAVGLATVRTAGPGLPPPRPGSAGHRQRSPPNIAG